MAESSLLETLGTMFPDSTRTTLRKMLEVNRVRVNGAIERDAKRRIVPDDVIDVASRGAAHMLDRRLTLLHEDEDLIVVIKAPGLLTVASPSEKEETAQSFLNDYLRARRIRGRIGVVHRLDRECSGVLVFTKNFETKEAMKERFASHDIDRVYLAIIEGTMPSPEGTIRSYLAEDRNYRVRSVSNPDKGRLAITHYKMLARTPHYSLLEVRLETGRKNQIRVHLSESSHPIVGDEYYGSKVDPIHRLGLHAKFLGFVHPRTGKRLEFTAPVPDSFFRLVPKAKV